MHVTDRDCRVRGTPSGSRSDRVELPFARAPRVARLLLAVLWGMILGLGAAWAADGGRADARETARGSRSTKEPPVVAPLLELRHGELDVHWQRTGDQRLTATAVLREPVLRVLRQRKTGGRENASQEEASEQSGKPPPGPGEVARDELALPVEVDRIEIHDMRVVFEDETVPGSELLAISALDLVIENFSTQRRASQGLPTLVSGRGRIGHEGRFALFVTLNPWTEKPDFAGRAQLTGLELEDLAGFVEDTIDLVPVQGTLAAFAEFSVRQGYIQGGVKPILANAEVAPADPGVVDRLKNWLVQTAIDVFSDDVPQRQAVVAVVPLTGRLENPNAQIWEIVVSLLENAFVEAISAGFKSVPPSPG